MSKKKLSADSSVTELNPANVKAYEGDLDYIFISYSHKNAKVVFPIIELLDKENYRIWYDEGINPGEQFALILTEKIRKCCIFLLFLSEETFTSDFVKFEIFTAYVAGKRICPIMIADKEVFIPAPFQPILNSLHQISARSKNDRAIKDMIDRMPKETKDAMFLSDDGLEVERGEKYTVKSSIPEGVISIKSKAFQNRVMLETVSLGKVERIGDEAFRSCTSLKEITIPGSITQIGDSCFRDCSELLSLKIERNTDNKPVEIGVRSFENCVKLSQIILPNNLTEIYGGVFNSCKNLKTIIIPDSVTIIGENAFGGCSQLEKIEIPGNVTKIDDVAFSGCSNLSEIILQEGLLKIGKNAFKDCSSIKNITIPVSVTKIDTSPFRGCLNLETISVKKSKYFKEEEGVLFNKSKSILICYPAKKKELASLNFYNIPDSVIEISEWAFCHCSFLKSIIIPDSVKEIGEGAFYKCMNLEYIDIPDSVTKIDDIAFRGCEKLKKVVIPDSVSEIGWGLFTGCHADLKIFCNQNSRIAHYCEEKNINFEILKNSTKVFK